MSTDTFDLFLSHNSQDKPLVIQLKQVLDRAKLRSWLDKDELPPGQNWQPLIENGLANSRAIAVCFGPAGIGPWQNEEMQAALNLAVRQKRPVIPVLLPGAPHQPTLPLFLQNRGWVDFRIGWVDEPLKNLVWGVTGVRPDTLGEAPPSPPPLTPEEYERKVREVFGAQYEKLKAILDKNRGLRAFLAEVYRVREAEEQVLCAKLLTAFHSNFLDAIAAFTRACRAQNSHRDGVADLLGTTMYLAMSPQYAEDLLKNGNGRVLEVNPQARRGIAEMLVAWVDGKGQEAVPLQNLTNEKSMGFFETLPQMAATAIKHDLMERLLVDKKAPDAATQLDIELDWLRRTGQRQFIALPVANEADKAVVRELKESWELQHAVVLVWSAGNSIHQDQFAKDPNYDQRFDTFLQKLVHEIQLPSLRANPS